MLGANAPAEAVVSVLVDDHALAPVTLKPCTCTSIAAPAATAPAWRGWRPAADAVVQLPAPEGLDCRLNPVAALWVPSTVGAAQFTVRLLPEPRASVGVPITFGANAPDEAVVSVVVADHALVPVILKAWTWTSIAVPAAETRQCAYGLVTVDAVVQVPAPEGLDHTLKPVAAL